MSAGFIDRHQVARGFARVASDYADGDFLVREIDRRMQERLDYVTLQPGRVIDLGCSRGGSFAGLAARYPAADLVGVDLVPAMLANPDKATAGWRRWLSLGRPTGPLRLAADASRVPLASGCAGLLWSNLLLHWLDDPLPVFTEAHRLLEVDGLLMFSTFGPDTLKELRAAFADGREHTQRFIDMHDLGDMLVGCGFADPVMDMEVITLTYSDLDALFADLRAAGATCAMRSRNHGLSGRRAWAAARAAYESLRVAGKLPATFEVVYGHAWKAAPKKLADGRAIISFDRPRER